jgi:hypothetical protein
LRSIAVVEEPGVLFWIVACVIAALVVTPVVMIFFNVGFFAAGRQAVEGLRDEQYEEINAYQASQLGVDDALDLLVELRRTVRNRLTSMYKRAAVESALLVALAAALGTVVVGEQDHSWPLLGTAILWGVSLVSMLTMFLLAVSAARTSKPTRVLLDQLERRQYLFRRQFFSIPSSDEPLSRGGHRPNGSGESRTQR